MSKSADRAAAGRAVQSMTGSGVAMGDCEVGRVAVEIRAVNGRGLSLRQRLAPECLRYDAAIESMLRARFVRGTFASAIDVIEPAQAGVSVDPAAFARAASTLRALAAEHRFDAPELRDVLSVPGVVGGSGGGDKARVSAELPPELAQLVADAIDALEARRVAEGRDTVASMRTLLAALLDELAEVRRRAPELTAAHRDGILSRVREYLDEHGTRLEPADVLREVALFADRSDVTEEMERLDAHAQRFGKEVAGSGPVGRDLEFLLQEMLREVNTLGSKARDVAIAHHVVAMKSSIDALKEQAANLE